MQLFFVDLRISSWVDRKRISSSTNIWEINRINNDNNDTTIIVNDNIMELRESHYLHIAETERKCFIEEIPDETMVIGMLCFKYLVVRCFDRISFCCLITSIHYVYIL